MKNIIKKHLLLITLTACLFLTFGQEKTIPIFKNGEAQEVEAFNTPEQWIRHDLFVETTFDTDGDGKLDRVHVDVTRPYQTDTEGLKLPIITVKDMVNVLFSM